MTKILCPEAKENELFSKKAFHRPSRGVFQGIKMWYFCQNSLSGIMSSYFSVQCELVTQTYSTSQFTFCGNILYCGSAIEAEHTSSVVASCLDLPRVAEAKVTQVGRVTILGNTKLQH